MQPNEYQTLARTTLVTTTDRDTLAMCGLGIAGEAGEICDVLKKHFFHKKEKPLDTNKIEDEAGDLLWYVAITADTLQISMYDLMPVLNFGPKGISLVLSALNLADGAGFMAGQLREYVQDNPSDTNEVNKLYYVGLLRQIVVDIAILAAAIDTTLEAIMQRNIDKLTARHKSNGAATGFNPHYVSDSVAEA